MNNIKRVLSVVLVLALVLIAVPVTDAYALTVSDKSSSTNMGTIGFTQKGETIGIPKDRDSQSQFFKFRTGRSLRVTIDFKIYDRCPDGVYVCLWNSDGERLRGDQTSAKNWIYLSDKEYTYDKFTMTLPKGTYYVEVKEYNTRADVAFDITTSGYIKKTMTLNSVKSNSTSSAILNWTAVKGIDGYDVYRATSKSGEYTKIARVEGASITKYVDSTVKSGKTYYYKVCAYDKTKGTQFTKFSSVKKVKIK